MTRSSSYNGLSMPKRLHGRKGNPISLAPLTGDQALAAALKISKEDVKKIQAATRKRRK